MDALANRSPRRRSRRLRLAVLISLLIHATIAVLLLVTIRRKGTEEMLPPPAPVTMLFETGRREGPTLPNPAIQHRRLPRQPRRRHRKKPRFQRRLSRRSSRHDPQPLRRQRLRHRSRNRRRHPRHHRRQSSRRRRLRHLLNKQHRTFHRSRLRRHLNCRRQHWNRLRSPRRKRLPHQRSNPCRRRSRHPCGHRLSRTRRSRRISRRRWISASASLSPRHPICTSSPAVHAACPGHHRHVAGAGLQGTRQPHALLGQR